MRRYSISAVELTVNFDRVARPYRWLEYATLGPWLMRCRIAQLRRLSNAHHAVVLGDGDGRFLARLLRAYPLLTADVVDSSQSMLSLLSRRLQKLDPPCENRVRLHHADALTWIPDRPFDLIVTHFFLDCFFPEQLKTLSRQLMPWALPGTRWVISEFAIPRKPVAAWFARTLIGLLYSAFGLLTGLPVRRLPDWETLPASLGFDLVSERRYLAGLLCSQIWCLAEQSTRPVPK